MGHWKLKREQPKRREPKPGPQWHQKSPATASGPRKEKARERKGRSRVQQLRERHARGEFGLAELARRIVQTWQSI